ncbi:MAG TPA: [FeFe] hydrogenase H-cluster radical SAM maturase HydE [Chitinispirillaceae bacterium]|jgi:biotin synthase|nr:[FeFe] hydrogenase H-cluster radical SAM maturase HydE [Chitinispirillaceae bacterium]
MENFISLLEQENLSVDQIARILSCSSDEDIEALRFQAEKVTIKTVSPAVYFRGLIELSNICSLDCYYCGIRRSNRNIRRYTLSRDEVLSAAMECVEMGYGSVVLQSGERTDDAFVDYIEDLINAIKTHSRSERLPEGLAITLSIGEQSEKALERFFKAGAHRYLLRIETSDPDLFARIHPADQSFEKRLSCLRSLREIGFMVGTGVMIGLPGQTLEMLARDILFFRDEKVDMIGMGPYIVHPDTPLANTQDFTKEYLFRLSLNMISVCRLVCPAVNIASTTALETLYPEGRLMGIAHGANVVMPCHTPLSKSCDYNLYKGKSRLNRDNGDSWENFLGAVKSLGHTPSFHAWGDSLHFLKRSGKLTCASDITVCRELLPE